MEEEEKNHSHCCHGTPTPWNPTTAKQFAKKEKKFKFYNPSLKPSDSEGENERMAQKVFKVHEKEKEKKKSLTPRVDASSYYEKSLFFREQNMIDMEKNYKNKNRASVPKVIDSECTKDWC